MQVLLVEADRMIGAAVEAALKGSPYAADWVHDGSAALAALDAKNYALVLLDLGLPALNGHAVLANIRRRNDPVPVLIFTAHDALDERRRGLDGGADDYLLKPFDSVELLARMRAVVRHHAGAIDPVMSNGIVSLDPRTREARIGDSAEMLSWDEFALLHALLMRPGSTLSRNDLQERIYDCNGGVESNDVETIICTIRKKLGGAIIKNVRDAGWRVSRAS